MYLTAIKQNREPFPGWAVYEREMAIHHAILLRFLDNLPDRARRKRLLEVFLDSLHFGGRRGRPRKARKDLESIHHGDRMDKLWEDELQGAWNKKASLELQGRNAKAELARTFQADVVAAVTKNRATPESSLASLYAHRANKSAGTARNALRAYQELTGTKFAPHV